MKNSRPLVIAHRGASAYKPGNTIDAFELALKQCADAIEIDVRQTADDVFVVIHSNYMLKGIHPVRVRSLSFKELLGIHSNVVMLEEIFRRFAGRTIFDLDIKEFRSAETLAALFKKYHVKRNDVFINSNKLRAIELLRSVLPQAKYTLSYALSGSVDLSRLKTTSTIFALMSRGMNRIMPQRFKRKAIQSNIYGVSLPYSLVYPGLVSYFHNHGIKVFAWPPDGERTFRRLLKFGVDGIKTARPDVLSSLLKRFEYS